MSGLLWCKGFPQTTGWLSAYCYSSTTVWAQARSFPIPREDNTRSYQQGQRTMAKAKCIFCASEFEPRFQHSYSDEVSFFVWITGYRADRVNINLRWIPTVAKKLLSHMYMCSLHVAVQESIPSTKARKFWLQHCELRCHKTALFRRYVFTPPAVEK